MEVTSRKAEKENYKNFENAERAVNDSFISFLMDLRFTFYFYNLYTRYILYFSIVCTYWNERLSERVYRFTRKIEKSCHSLHIWLHKDRSPCLTLSLLQRCLYTYMGLYIYIRELFKNEKFTRKEFKYLPNCICISKIYPLFFRVLKFILYWFINVISMFSLKIIKFI